MRIILLVLYLLAIHAEAKEYNFNVAYIGEKNVKVIAFNCETKGDELLCNTRDTSLGYYNWGKDDKEVEPKRCLVYVKSGKETYAMKSIGIWARRERSACGTLVEYVIRPVSEGKIEFDEITLESNYDHSSVCENAFGKSGTIKHYKKHDILSRIPFACTSIVVFP